jgi:tripartite-type tricarboxylate transporter receptor subunit TctC
LVKSGKLRLLAVASAQRLRALPDVPAVAEKLPGFESVAWYAIVAPPQTPKAIVDKINADVNAILKEPEVRERLKKLSAEIYGGSVAKTAKYMHEEVDRWNGVIQAAHIKIQ